VSYITLQDRHMPYSSLDLCIMYLTPQHFHCSIGERKPVCDLTEEHFKSHFKKNFKNRQYNPSNQRELNYMQEKYKKLAEVIIEGVERRATASQHVEDAD
jgi:hypothetical protein